MAETTTETTEVSPLLARLEASTVTSDNFDEYHAVKKSDLAPDSAPTEADSKPEPAPEKEVSGDDEKAVAEKPVNPKLEKRFSEVTRQREEAKAEAAKERDARVALEARLAELERPKVTQESQSNDEPQPSQFDDAFEYSKALSKYSVQQALAQRDLQDAQRVAEAAKSKVIDTWNAKLEAAKATLPDFDDMVNSADVAVPDFIRDSIVESDVGPQLLYYFAENPEIARSLAAMPAIKALREMGKLEAKFEAETLKTDPKPAAVSKSKAPEPISPLKSVGSSADVPLSADGEFTGTYAQFLAARKSGRLK